MKKRFLRIRVGGWILWGVLGLIVAASVLLVVTRAPPEPPVETETRPYPVRVLHIAPRPIADTISLPGRLAARRDALLGTERAGRITALHVDRGDAVREGAALLEVNDRIWRSHLVRAEIERDETRRDLVRLTELRETGAVADRDFDAAAARAAHAEAAWEQAETHLSQCTVRAPFDGLVDERMIDLGEFATEGRAVFRLVATDPLTLRLSVPERDVQALEIGQSLAFSLDAFAGEAFEASVRSISFTADPGANTYAMEADVANPDGRLRAGMIARVRLTRRLREEALAVPLAAILPRRGEDVIFLVQDGRAVRRVVAIDALVGTDAVLARGIAADDRVVIEGHRDLGDGAPVEIVETEPRGDHRP